LVGGLFLTDIFPRIEELQDEIWSRRETGKNDMTLVMVARARSIIQAANDTWSSNGTTQTYKEHLQRHLKEMDDNGGLAVFPVYYPDVLMALRGVEELEKAVNL
jgi:hypothetical protein